MKKLLTAVSWTVSAVLLIVAMMIFGMGGLLQSALMLGLAALFFPPLNDLVRRKGFNPRWWMKAAAAAVLYSALLLSFRLNPAVSIYKSPQYHEELIRIYDEKLAKWPVPFESRYIETQYGTVHVIVSGPEDGYPVLLINASGVAAWSWIFNAGALNKKYRTYAVDNIGEAGKNTLKRPGYIPETAEDIAACYEDITEKLGFSRSHVIGASVGGYIATCYAIHRPQRVNRLVLSGSMGFGFTPRTIITMMLAQGFPVKPVQDATFVWAFGDAPHVTETFGPWFRLVMKGMVPTPVMPRSLSAEDLSGVSAPALVYVGTKDAVVGSHGKAAALAANIPDVRVEVVDSGHLIAAELADRFNTEVMAFFAEGDGD